jgi:outer membrane protein TolC
LRPELAARLRQVDPLPLPPVAAPLPVAPAAPAPSPGEPGVTAPGSDPAEPLATAGSSLDLEPPARTKVLDRVRAAAEQRPASGGELYPLTLASLRQDVLANDLGLAVELYDPAIAEEEHRAEAARFEAVLGATVRRESAVGSAGERVVVSTIAPGLTLPLPPGTVLGVEAGDAYTERGEPPAGAALPAGVTSGASHTPWVGFSLSQPLLRGLGAANTAPVRQAALRVRVADARAKVAVVRLLAQAEQTYWEYYCAHTGLQLQLHQHELTRRQEASARRLVEEGVRTEVEITRARAAVAERIEAILVAETRRRLAERALKRMLRLDRLPLDGPTILRPDSLPAPEPRLFDRGLMVALALQDRAELVEGQLQEAIARLDEDTARNAALPELRLDFRYSFSAARPRLDDAIDQLTREASRGWSGGLTFELPLGNGAAAARRRAAVLVRARSEASRRLLEQAVTEEVLGAIDAVESSWEQIAANRDAVVLAQQAYAAEQLQFQQGFVTGNEVNLALAALARAQSAELEATCAHQKSLVDLAVATGTVAGEGGVSWAPQEGEGDRP